MWGQPAFPGIVGHDGFDAKRIRLGGYPVTQQFPGQVPMMPPLVGVGAPFGTTAAFAQPLTPQMMCMLPGGMQAYGMPTLQPQAGLFAPAAPAGASDPSLTRSIFEALQSHQKPEPLIQEVTSAPVFDDTIDDNDLRAKLLSSMRGLLPEGQESEANTSDPLQELRRAVQAAQEEDAPAAQPAQSSASEALPVPRSPPVAAGPPAAVDPEPEPASAHVPELVPEPPSPPNPSRFGDDTDDDLRDPRDPREEDMDSDDGVPHRLPPGFGAIPEDIVEERARQKEEQIILQLKATQPCRFGRRCKKRDCPNMHHEGRDIDTEWNPCAFGQRCKRKDCFYDHPEGRIIDDKPELGMCKFGARCSRPDCLYNHPPERTAMAGADPRICFFCHGSGHIATDCPRNPDSWASRLAEGAAPRNVSSQRALTS